MENTLITGAGIDVALDSLQRNYWIKSLGDYFYYHYFNTLAPHSECDDPTLVYLAYVIWRHEFNVEFALRPSMHLAFWHHASGGARPVHAWRGDAGISGFSGLMREVASFSGNRKASSVSALTPSEYKDNDVFYFGHQQVPKGDGSLGHGYVFGLLRGGVESTCTDPDHFKNLLYIEKP